MFVLITYFDTTLRFVSRTQLGATDTWICTLNDYNGRHGSIKNTFLLLRKVNRCEWVYVWNGITMCQTEIFKNCSSIMTFENRPHRQTIVKYFLISLLWKKFSSIQFLQNGLWESSVTFQGSDVGVLLNPIEHEVKVKPFDKNKKRLSNIPMQWLMSSSASYASFYSSQKSQSRSTSTFWMAGCYVSWGRWQPEQFISQFPYQHTLSG